MCPPLGCAKCDNSALTDSVSSFYCSPALILRKNIKEFYMPKNKPQIVNIPKANYIAVRGTGNPNEEGGACQQAISILYAIAYTIKLNQRQIIKEGFFEYVVSPLEGFGWQDNVEGVDYADKSTFN